MFDLREVVFDRWNDKGVTNRLTDDGFSLRRSVTNLLRNESAFTKGFLDSLAAGNLRHVGQPVLRWNADCLTLRSDGHDNVQPAKPDRLSAATRIDIIVASIMAHGRAMAAPKKKTSVYANPDTAIM